MSSMTSASGSSTGGESSGEPSQYWGAYRGLFFFGRVKVLVFTGNGAPGKKIVGTDSMNRK